MENQIKEREKKNPLLLKDSLSQSLVERAFGYEQVHSGFVGSIKDVPEEERFNEHIHSGYRCQFIGVYGAARTLFMIHNETFNIWSHLLGSIFFLGMVIYVVCVFPNMAADG